MWSLTFQREKVCQWSQQFASGKKHYWQNFARVLKTSSPEKKKQEQQEDNSTVTSAIHGIFANLNNPLSPKFADEHALSKMKET